MKLTTALGFCLALIPLMDATAQTSNLEKGIVNCTGALAPNSPYDRFVANMAKEFRHSAAYRKKWNITFHSPDMVVKNEPDKIDFIRYDVMVWVRLSEHSNIATYWRKTDNGYRLARVEPFTKEEVNWKTPSGKTISRREQPEYYEDANGGPFLMTPAEIQPNDYFFNRGSRFAFDAAVNVPDTKNCRFMLRFYPDDRAGDSRSFAALNTIKGPVLSTDPAIRQAGPFAVKFWLDYEPPAADRN